MFYLVRPSWILKRLYQQCIWSIKTTDNILFLSFDDGPHPSITPFVLDELKKYNAHATFFCIGKNVVAYPEIYKRIIDEGHSVGNHTYRHLNGWKTEDKLYLNDIAEAKKYIDSDLFRPPYGKVRFFQLKQLPLARFQLKTIMWSVLSGDFDTKLSKEKCYANVVNNSRKGNIVVFHDSEKAFERMSYSLPLTLKYFSEKQFSFKKITSDLL